MDTNALAKQAMEFLTLYGMNIIGAILILVLGWIIAKAMRSGLRRMMGHAKLDETLIGFSVNIVYYLVLTAAIIAALGRLGVPTASLLAVLGTAGLAVGLALKDSLSNFASGVMLLLFRPFRVGDVIEGGGTLGTVLGIQMFQTKIATPDNKEVTVPNSKLTADNVINFNARGTRRVELVFGIGYDDDIEQAKSIINAEITADARVLKDPEPFVHVIELGESSVNIACRPWANAPDWWSLTCDLQQRVKEKFDQAGISIPFPQRDIHVINGDKAA